VSTGRLHIRVTGLAQGIGYRPFVHRLATARGLTGWVANTGAGVEIELEGPEQGLLAATRALADDGLEGQRRLQWQRLEPLGYAEFTIAASQRRGAGASPPRDLAPCAHCLKELFDPSNRRYRYPFIACARCGPRYSILLDLPWDRARTTLAAFPLCPLCRAEYQDPQDRRFHAEATGCGACGPRLALQGADGEHGTGAAAAGAPRVLRLGRGYAPLELTLKHAQREPLVALGGDLKHSAALAAGDRVMLTPYVGDLASEGALRRAR